MKQLKFDPKQCALLIVDVQVDFCSPDGATARRGRSNKLMQALPAKINAFVREMPDVLPIYVKAIVDESRLAPNQKLFNEMKGVRRPTQLGSGGEEFYGLEISPDAIIVEKTWADPFNYTNLTERLTKREINTVLVCGVRTEICVDATARRASSEGFNVVVVSDLVATRDDNVADGEHALKFLDAYVGFVMDSTQVKQILS